ncbi:MAG: GAF domain-containing sensor histidine kinase [Chloroflexi bacterium]|nr:GAF domain-containing sensor histidine kinase [Chloroflexota bacterium]
MHHRTLRWLTIAGPILFLAVVDLVRHQVWPELLHPWPGYFIVLSVVALAVGVFSGAVFDRIEGMENRILGQNRELRRVGETAERQAAQLRGLHEAGLVLSAELTLETVLRRIVDLARELTGARYGALAVVDDQQHIVRFLTAGLSPEERAQLGDPPLGRGLLGPIFEANHPLRVADIARDPRSVGFPAGHPPMQTFMGVPIVLHGRVYGNLYLTDKQGADGPIPFTEDDEQGVTLFAAQAAVAMENARLHGQVQGLAASVERERIARELHDSLAQALGYVRLRASSARESLAHGDCPATDTALRQIGEIVGETYGEVREAILGLRSSGGGADRPLVDVLAEYIDRYHEQSGVEVAFEIGPGVAQVRLAPAVEVQLVRIVQESLANVRKHARTSQAALALDIVVHAGGPRLRVIVTDEGRGFDLDLSPVGAHFGLAIMRERAEGVGGSFSIKTAPGQGTRITVTMPIEAAPSAANGTAAPER